MLRQTECTDGDLGQLVHLLSIVARRLRGGPVPAPLAAAFREGSLGPRHMPPLFAVARRGPMSVGELAERLGIAPTTASLLVNELDRAGLLERHEDEDDRRRTIVSVPEEHRTLLVRLAEERVAVLRRTLERLSPEGREHFAAGLRILAEESEAIGAEREATP